MRYAGFISYSRQDEAFARWLFHTIETTRRPNGGQGKRTCFLDTAEIVPGPSLPTRLEDALAQSEWLIVVLSPDAAKSAWVNQEIETFARVRGADRILGIIARGEPTERPLAGESAVPPALIAALQNTPLFADARQRSGRRRAALQILAAMDGVPVDAFLRRDAQRRTRVLAIGVAASALVLTLVAGLAWRTSTLAQADQLYAQARGQLGFERIRLLVASARAAQSAPLGGGGPALEELARPENKLLLGVIATRRGGEHLHAREDYGDFASQDDGAPLYISDGSAVFRLARTIDGAGLTGTDRMREASGEQIGANTTHLLFGGDAECSFTLVERSSGREQKISFENAPSSCSATLGDGAWVWTSGGALYRARDGEITQMRPATPSATPLTLTYGSPPLRASFDADAWRLTLHDLQDERIVARIDLPRTGYSERPEELVGLQGAISRDGRRLALAADVRFLTAQQRTNIEAQVAQLQARQNVMYTQAQWEVMTRLLARLNGNGNGAYLIDLPSGAVRATLSEVRFDHRPSWRFRDDGALADLIFRSDVWYLRLQTFNGAPDQVISLATGRMGSMPSLSADGRRLRHMQSEFAIDALTWDVNEAIAFFCRYRWPEVQLAADAVHQRARGISGDTPCV